MSRSPAAELARLKVTYGQEWRIVREPNERNGKLIATDRVTDYRLIAATTGELESLLMRDFPDGRFGG